jgi:hypothetical protein
MILNKLQFKKFVSEENCVNFTQIGIYTKKILKYFHA